MAMAEGKKDSVVLPFYYSHVWKNVLLLALSAFCAPLSAALMLVGLAVSKLHGQRNATFSKEDKQHVAAARRRKTILVTGVSMTKSLTIARNLSQHTPHRIIGADISRREDEKGLRASQAMVEQLIAQEKARGVPAERIVLAGFSQGCAMTLQTGLRHHERLAGLMCLSGYVPLHTTIAAERHAANQDTPIFLAHGRGDQVIPIIRAEQTRDLLKSLGYDVEWHEYMMPHSVCQDEVEDIGAWMRRVLA